MDANATTPLLPEVVEAMRPFWIEQFGNPSSIHQQGQQARAAIDRARESVARLLNCRATEIVFTSGGTESDNLALFGILQSYLAKKPHLITTTIEHHAVLHAAQALAERGAEVTFLDPTPEGLIDPATLAAALRPNTKLVSIMLANNETGVIQPIEALAALTRSAGALFHTDAVQAAAKLPLDLSEKGPYEEVDLLSLSGHKMYAPQGTGILFVRRKTPLTPIFFGGSHERQRRPGTENVPGIVALGKASELAAQWLASEAPQALARLRNRLEQGLLNSIPNSGINGVLPPRVPNTTNLYFQGIDAEALLIALDLQGLSISAGSACQSGATEPSHVLTAMRLPKARAKASIRISLSRLTTASEVDTAIALITKTVNRLRAL
jgi:cysteine desulfurase